MHSRGGQLGALAGKNRMVGRTESEVNMAHALTRHQVSGHDLPARRNKRDGVDLDAPPRSSVIDMQNDFLSARRADGSTISAPDLPAPIASRSSRLQRMLPALRDGGRCL